MKTLLQPWRNILPRRVWHNFAPRSKLDLRQFQREMAKPQPETEYVMFFTPRSGSSWLADVLTRTGQMGRVTESFNPNFLPKMTRQMNAASLADYCAVLPRRMQSGNTFGFQITLFQMRAVFRRDRDFLQNYATQPWIWLIRSDIVLQAISLYKMEVGRVTHAPNLNLENLAEIDRNLPYDRERIRYWLEHVHAMERETEALFRSAGVHPLRLNYERNIGMKSNHIANVIGRYAGRPTMRMKEIRSRHVKLGTQRNTVLADRFREEQADLLDRVHDERAARIENSLYYGPKGSF